MKMFRRDGATPGIIREAIDCRERLSLTNAELEQEIKKGGYLTSPSYAGESLFRFWVSRPGFSAEPLTLWRSISFPSAHSYVCLWKLNLNSAPATIARAIAGAITKCILMAQLFDDRGQRIA